MLSKSTPLTPKQVEVLALLAEGKTISAAAEESGIHRNTISNWRRSSETFRQEWQWMLTEQAEHWREEVHALAPLAVDALFQILIDREAPEGARIRAALAVLDKASAVPSVKPDPKRSNVIAMPKPESEPDPTTERSDAPEPAVRAARQRPVVVQPTKRAKSAQSCTIARRRLGRKPAVNKVCICGSGAKYKRCCGARKAA